MIPLQGGELTVSRLDMPMVKIYKIENTGHHRHSRSSILTYAFRLQSSIWPEHGMFEIYDANRVQMK